MAPRPRSEPARLRAGALGLDVGGTKVSLVLLGADGSVDHHGGRHAHGNPGFEEVLARIGAVARPCFALPGRQVRSVGIGVAAQVDERTGCVIHAPNLRWNDVPLGARVAEMLGTRVTVMNDARAATYGEWRHGAGAGRPNLFCLTIGTGVGGSAIVENRLVRGANGAFGEVGHSILVSGGRRCHCGNRGCLEAYVGGWAIAERALEKAREHPSAARAWGAGGSEREPYRFTAREVFQAYRRGDRLASKLVQETLAFIADGAVGIVNAFDPGRLLLVGGVVAGLPECVDAAREAIRKRTQPPVRGTEVLAGTLGEDAVAIGAAAFGRDSPGARRPTRAG